MVDTRRPVRFGGRGGGGSDLQSQSQLSSAFPQSTHQLPRRSSHLLSLCPDGPSPSVSVGPAGLPSATSPEWCSWGPMGKPSSDGTVELSQPLTLTTGRIATSLACWLGSVFGSANPRCHCDQPDDHEDGTAIPLSRLDRPSRIQAADASSIREDVSRNLEKNYQHRQSFILSFTPPVTLYNGRQGSFRRCRHGGDRRRCPPRRGAPELRQPVVSSLPSRHHRSSPTDLTTGNNAADRATPARPAALRAASAPLATTGTRSAFPAAPPRRRRRRRPSSPPSPRGPAARRLAPSPRRS